MRCSFRAANRKSRVRMRLESLLLGARRRDEPSPRSSKRGDAGVGHFETLEDRMVLSAAWCIATERPEFAQRRWQATPTPPVEVLFAPGTPQQYVDEIESGGSEEPPAPFTLQSRWSTTATDGSGLTNGDVTTLTWSIAPDGTAIGAIGNISAESTDDSNLVAYMRGIYGDTDTDTDYTNEAWFQQFESVFDRWSELTGITYVYEPNDDGAEFQQFSFFTPGSWARAATSASAGTGSTATQGFWPTTSTQTMARWSLIPVTVTSTTHRRTL